MKKFVILCLLTFIFSAASAQANKAETVQFMAKKTYVFIPTRVTPIRGQPTDLIGYLFFMSVKPDTITTYLPSFGAGGMDGPGVIIDRTRGEYQSVKFDYQTEKAKNGSWNISINFKDSPGAVGVRMRLWVNKNGYGTLTVNKTSQATATYYGYLKATDQRSLAK